MVFYCIYFNFAIYIPEKAHEETCGNNWLNSLLRLSFLFVFFSLSPSFNVEWKIISRADEQKPTERLQSSPDLPLLSSNIENALSLYICACVIAWINDRKGCLLVLRQISHFTSLHFTSFSARFSCRWKLSSPILSSLTTITFTIPVNSPMWKSHLNMTTVGSNRADQDKENNRIWSRCSSLCEQSYSVGSIAYHQSFSDHWTRSNVLHRRRRRTVDGDACWCSWSAQIHLSTIHNENHRAEQWGRREQRFAQFALL